MSDKILADSVFRLALRYSQAAYSRLFLPSNSLALFCSRPSICAYPCFSASSVAMFQWFSKTQQSIAFLYSPSFSQHLTAQSAMPASWNLSASQLRSGSFSGISSIVWARLSQSSSIVKASMSPLQFLAVRQNSAALSHSNLSAQKFPSWLVILPKISSQPEPSFTISSTPQKSPILIFMLTARSFLSIFLQIFSASSYLVNKVSISAFCFSRSSKVCIFFTYFKVLKSSTFNSALSALRQSRSKSAFSAIIFQSDACELSYTNFMAFVTPSRLSSSLNSLRMADSCSLKSYYAFRFQSGDTIMSSKQQQVTLRPLKQQIYPQVAICGPTITLVTVVSLLFSIKHSCCGWSSLHLSAQHSFFSNSSTLPPCELISSIFSTPVISISPSLVQSLLMPMISGRGFQNNLLSSVICGRVNLLKRPLSLPIISRCSVTAAAQTMSSVYLVLSNWWMSQIWLMSGLSSMNQQISRPILRQPACVGSNMVSRDVWLLYCHMQTQFQEHAIMWVLDMAWTDTSRAICLLSIVVPMALHRSIWVYSCQGLEKIAQNSPSPLIQLSSFTYFMYFQSDFVSQKTTQNSTRSVFWQANTRVPFERQHHLQLGLTAAQQMAEPAAIAILSPFPSQVMSLTVSALGILKFLRWLPLPSKNLTTARFSSYSREQPATAMMVPAGFHLTLLSIMEVSTAIGSSSLSFFMRMSLPCWQAMQSPTGASSEYIWAQSNQSMLASGMLGVRKCSGYTMRCSPCSRI